ncbi:uncharacterized protein [Nicotiana tomentosiformis]|uniref:uncharacterized protein n=1 Tax=Nicotiana tomentosiformis TaxID=4098 RepID=UPI00388C848F
MRKEFEALEANHTWFVVPLLVGKKAIGSKWEYKIKFKADGSVESLFTKRSGFGTLELFLEIEVTSTSASLLLNQRKFILDLLSDHKCAEVSPLDLTLKLKAADGGASDYGILLNDSYAFALHGYCDSDWVACPHSCKSVTDFFVLLGRKLTWLTRLLADLCVEGVTHVSMFCDNQSALHIARNPVFHERTKHIKVHCHFVRRKLSDDLIALFIVSIANQLADILTKPLTGLSHHGFLSKLKEYYVRRIKGVEEHLGTYPTTYVPLSNKEQLMLIKLFLL